MKPLIATASMLLATSASAAPQPALQTAVLAGGCYWGMEMVFEHVKGVHDVVSGHAGGSRPAAGPAEAVRIRFDPRQVSYGDLLRIYFTVAHDPTQVNRQGPDVGPNYRSAIFPLNTQQKAAATQAIAQLSRSRKIATRLESGAFVPVGASQQDFARKHPNHGYIVAHDRPKVAKLKRAFPTLWRG